MRNLTGCLIAVFLAATFAVLPSAEAGEIEVKNECFISVDVAVRYLDSRDKKWKTEYWYNYSPGEEAYLLGDNKKRLKTKNDLMYFYAESTKYGVVWTGEENNESDRTYKVGDRYLRFREVEDWGFDLDLDLGCDSILDAMEERCTRRCGRNCMRYKRQFGFDSSGNTYSNSGYSVDRECAHAVNRCTSSCMTEMKNEWKANNER